MTSLARVTGWRKLGEVTSVPSRSVVVEAATAASRGTAAEPGAVAQVLPGQVVVGPGRCGRRAPRPRARRARACGPRHRRQDDHAHSHRTTLRPVRALFGPAAASRRPSVPLGGEVARWSCGAVVGWLWSASGDCPGRLRRAYDRGPMATTMRPSLRSRAAGYVALTKPRIIELLLVTTVPTMVVAERGIPPVWLMVATVVGGTLAAGGANAINMYVDRDIDALMKRTQNRPLVTGSDQAQPRPGVRHRARGGGLRLAVGLREPHQRRAGHHRLPVLRVRVHALAQAHLQPQHRHRRRGRRRAGADRVDGGDRPPGLGARSCCSPSSSTGPRRTSGPWPSATRTTTPPPTCPCSRRWPASTPPRCASCSTPCCCGR